MKSWKETFWVRFCLQDNTFASYHRLLIITNTAPPDPDHRRICIIEGAVQQSDEYFNTLYAARSDP